jgi:integrase
MATSEKEETTKVNSCPTRSRTDEVCRSEQPDFKKWPAHVRPCDQSLRSKRNYAILALLIPCGLRRGELLTLSAASVQLREDHWAVAGLHGKPGTLERS